MLATMGFRENLKAELAYRGMLVKELAYRSGVKKRTLDSYLRGDGAAPSAQAAVSIAGALDVSVEYLVTGRERRGEGALPPADLRPLLKSLEALDEGDRGMLLTLARTLGACKPDGKDAIRDAVLLIEKIARL